jgi:hypothetical protein
MRVVFLFLSLFGTVLIPILLLAQEKPDTTRIRTDTTQVRPDTTKAEQIIHDIKESKISKRIMKSITRKRSSDPAAAVKSEEAFIPYQGKIIRKILIRHIDFQKTVYDTTRNIRNTITRIGNKLHSTSKDWLIRDNLFIRENKPVNPYKLADNERHLRDLDFLLDAKFYIIPLQASPDSVDVVVLTRDVFSLGGTVNPANPSRTRIKLYDANLLGWGQRLQFNAVVEPDRHPDFVYEFLYRKNSIAGTFINGTVGYTQLNTGSSYGEEEEKAYYIRFDRPLVSPYTRYAGGMEISRNWAENFFSVSDSLFKDYRYVVNDFWIGYNIGANRNFENRSRHFVAIRAFDQHFTRVPFQSREQSRPLYNDQTFVLTSVTFFKQDFYTARYIYGFGRTEDVPYGHHVSLTMGWARQRGLDRPYVGIEAEKSLVTRLGEFYTVGFRAGGFANSGLEDATLLFSGSLTSRLIPQGEFLFRQSIQVDYTRVYKQRTSIPLDINNEFGLQYFRADSLWGTKRFNIHSETLAFSPWQLLGFRFAPFVFGEMAMISGPEASIFYKPYFGFGGGIRTRNENLIFGTVEMRIIYYPRTVEDISAFNIRFTSNLRIKYSAGFVRAPGFVRYN